jgi:predicted DNA-binding WGR domain protein
MRRFELVEGTSRKFWEIALSGAAFTVRYGRLDTDGQSLTKRFDTPERATSEADKLVREKTRKGYREIGRNAPSTPAKNERASSRSPAAAKPRAARAANRDVEKLIKKIAGGRPTAGTYEAVIDAAALLALGGHVPSALESFHLLWLSPERVHRLLVAGEDARDDSHATHLYRKLGARAAAAETARALGISKAQLLAKVEEGEKELRSTLKSYRDELREWGTGKRKDVAKALELLRTFERSRQRGAPDEALALALELLERGEPHPYELLRRRLIVADLAFAAGAKAEARQFIKRAAEAEREETDTIYSSLEVLLSFEWSALALLRGELALAPLDEGAAKRLFVTIRELFAGASGPSASKVEWRPLLTKLAGAKALRGAAAGARIKSLEKRLGVQLPASYRDFLSTSDGLGNSRRSLALSSVEDVGWFRDRNRSWIDAYREEGADIPHLNDTLQISEARDGEVYLLNPSVEAAGEWEAWHFANHVPGETRYTSFLDLIHNLLEA